MKSRSFIFTSIFSLFGLALCFVACSKNENFIAGDAKVRYFQIAITDTTQNFYLNGIQSGNSTVYGSNSNYIVVAGDSTYKITSRRINTTPVVASVDQKFDIGAHYSIFYTRKSPTDSASLLVFKDDVKKDLDSAKLTFINLGYMLGSNTIQVKDAGNAFAPFTLAYGNRVTYKIKVTKATKIFFDLTNPIATQKPVDSLDSAGTTVKKIAISKGRVYTVLLDGNKASELQMRLIQSN
ncbi:DUF4397 domain-containing protein [Pedobacter rhizosphaerae]|uniref:DUF4397 domain-containing protein n=1 Tax=Pedobacter rhizosphaerae TaxID=390241 RepID=A0A1H9Q2A2_9SPHI|nr:DUF4397 domain-containing protein [Pedobacter rhizosphaerae]SER54548.1 protein of unknown function [Pedobacter rhizosphaerae]